MEELRALEGEDDPLFFQTLVEQFVRDVPRLVSAIQHAVEQGDAQALMQTAHRLKGCARNIGTPWLAELSSRLEDQGHRQVLSESQDLFMEVQSAVAQAIASLQMEVNPK